MIKDTYLVEIMMNAICPAKGTIAQLFKDSAESGIKSIIGANPIIGGKFPVYIDSEEKNNMYGIIKAISNDDGVLDSDDISMIASGGNYEIILKELVDEKNLKGDLNLLVGEGAAVQSSSSELTQELNRAIEEAIEKGFVSKEEMDKRLAVMNDNYVDEYLQLRVIRSYRKYKKPTHRPSCIYVDPYISDTRKRKEEGIIAEGLREAVSRNAIICEGEKSVGKNVYLETIAWLMGQPQYLLTFTRQMSPSHIYGEKSTDNSAAEALAEFDSNILAKADIVNEKIRFGMNLYIKTGIGADEAMKNIMEGLSSEDKDTLQEAARFRMLQAQSSSVNIITDASEVYDWMEDGGQMVFNEMNLAEANFFASFANQLLDGTGYLFFPGRGEIPVHPDCVLFGTQNADYAGVEQQNDATMSRFGCIVFPQPKEVKKQLIVATEAKLKKDGFPNVKLDKKYFNECQSFYSQCRAAVLNGAITNAALNIRGFVRALTVVAESNGYAKLKRAVEKHVINTCPLDDRVALVALLENIVTL